MVKNVGVVKLLCSLDAHKRRLIKPDDLTDSDFSELLAYLSIHYDEVSLNIPISIANKNDSIMVLEKDENDHFYELVNIIDKLEEEGRFVIILKDDEGEKYNYDDDSSD